MTNPAQAQDPVLIESVLKLLETDESLSGVRSEIGKVLDTVQKKTKANPKRLIIWLIKDS